MKMKDKFKGWIIPFFIFIFTFSVYIYTLCPTISPAGDSGELITVAYTLGIAHPPGYPLFTLLGNLFTKIPFGSIAWRVNLMSAFFHSLTVVLIYFILKILMNSADANSSRPDFARKRSDLFGGFFAGWQEEIIAICGALILAFSYTFWLYSLVAEVFALNDFFAVLLILIILKWREKRVSKYQGVKVSERYLYLFSFIFGLAMSNHHTIVLLLPAFFYLIWTTDKNVFNIFETKNYKFFIFYFLFFIFGLLPYSYLFWAGKHSQSPIVWIYAEDLQDLWRMFFRQDYGTFTPLGGYQPELIILKNKIQQIINYFRFSLDDFTIFGMVFFLIGLMKFFKKDKRTVPLFLFIAFASSLFFLAYAAFPIRRDVGMLGVLERFYLLPNMLFVIFIIFGVLFLSRFLRLITLFFLFFLVLLIFWKNFPLVNQMNNKSAYLLGKNILNTSKENSLVFSEGDVTTFAILYLRYGENYRDDIEIILPSAFSKKNEMKYLKNKRRDLLYLSEDTPSKFIKNNLEKVDIYTVGIPSFNKNLLSKMAPYGFLFKLIKENRDISVDEIKKENELLLSDVYFLPGDRKTYYTISENFIKDLYFEFFFNLGDYFFQKKEEATAETYFQRSLKYDPYVILAWLKLGDIYLKRKDCQKAKNAYLMTLSINSQANWVYKNLIEVERKCFQNEKEAKRYEKLWQEYVKEQEGDLRDL